eukprot:4397102-Alexandrium_andersonii.AAC.1
MQRACYKSAARSPFRRNLAKGLRVGQTASPGSVQRAVFCQESNFAAPAGVLADSVGLAE